MWRLSEVRYDGERRDALRREWIDFHRTLETNFRSLAREHAELARALEEAQA